jgi:hypothetical protein
MERLIELTKRHKVIMDTKNIIVSIYTNASGFLWSMCMVDSGTDLGYSEFNGNCEFSGSFIEYEDALEDALNMIDLCDLDKFRSEVTDRFHWGNYTHHLDSNYRNK